MSSRRIKKQVLALLAEPSLATVLAGLDPLPRKDTINVLFSAICRIEEILRWHAVSAMGVAVASLAQEDMEEARIMMRRLLWSLNDESGGIGWGAPESMAEIMHNHEGLAREYIHMLISYMRPDGEELEQDGNFLEHETLQRGLLWGIGRLSGSRPALLLANGVDEDLPLYLNSPDAMVRGLAVQATGLLACKPLREVVVRLSADTGLVRLYQNGLLSDTTVGDLARAALSRLNK